MHHFVRNLSVISKHVIVDDAMLPLTVNPDIIFFIKLAHSASDVNLDTSLTTRCCSGPREKVRVHRPFCQSASFTECMAFDNCEKTVKTHFHINNNA